MILRLWSGYTTHGQAAEYDRILDTDVAPGIVRRGLRGLEQFEVWTRVPAEAPDEREFLTAMWFRDLDGVTEFTRGDLHGSVVPPQARAALNRFDEHSRHYELRRQHLPRK